MPLPTANTDLTTPGNSILTAEALAGTSINRSGPTSPFVDTTDTADDIFGVFFGLPSGVGWTIEYRNKTPYGCMIVGGTGVSFVGSSSIPPLTSAQIRFFLTGGRLVRAQIMMLTPSSTTLGTKLRSLAASAAMNNPVINPPMLTVPAWAENTAYVTGNVVSNSGNQYLCYVGGTAIPSGSGPSSVAAQAIPDNSITWYYYGPVITGTGQTVTLTESGSTSLALSVTYAANPTAFLLNGGVPSPGSFSTTGLKAMTVLSSGNISTNAQQTFARWSFMSDAPALDINYLGSAPFRVIVDGQYITLSGTSAGGGGQRYVHIAWGGVRKARRYEFEVQANIHFLGVLVDAASSVWAPVPVSPVTACFVGDSLTVGGNAFPVLPGDDYPSLLSRMLGIPTWVNQGTGGCGYAATNSGTVYSLNQRPISDLTNFNPDLVVIFGGQNDTNSGLAPAALQYFQIVRATLPNAVVIVLGRWPAPASGGSLGSTVMTCEQEITDAFNAWNDPNSFLVPITLNAAPGSPLTGTGKITSTTGTGNADIGISSDGVHPIEAFINYFSYWFLQQMKAIIHQIP